MTNDRPIFFSSDWHIGHAKVIEYSKRPFRDVHHMAEVLINNYNSTVTPEGVCYFLGDMGVCKPAELGAVVSRLNGTKILILGNHDKGTQAMYKLGFSAVLYGAQFLVSRSILTASHCPLMGIKREDLSDLPPSKGTNWHGDHKNQRYSMPNFGQFHLHGHLHAPNSGRSQVRLDRQWDVGIDGNSYRPVSMSRIESWIATYGR